MSGRGEDYVKQFFVGQKVEYFGGDDFHDERYIGQKATVTGIDYRGYIGWRVAVKWDNDGVLPNKTWRPLLQNIRPVAIDVGDLEDDY